jgi:hypothetical protein
MRVKNARLTFVDFGEVVPENFEIGWIWNCIGRDGQGNIYVGMGGQHSDSSTDVAVFRYIPRTSEKTFLTMLSTVSEKDGNLQPGEPFFKGHSQIAEMNGRLYLSTQGFHDITIDRSEMDSVRGGHIFEFEIASGQWHDLSRSDSMGVSAPHQGIIAIDTIPSRNQIVGSTVPLGDVLIYDISRQKTIRYYSAPEHPLNLNVSRVVSATEKAIYTQYSGSPIYKIDPQTGIYAPLGRKQSNGFFTAMARSWDRKDAYFITLNGFLYHFRPESEYVEDLMLFLTSKDPNMINDSKQDLFSFSLAISPDETCLYTLFTNDANGRNGLYEYQLASGTIRKVEDFTEQLREDCEWSCINGCGVWDDQGCLYFANYTDKHQGRLLRIEFIL